MARRLAVDQGYRRRAAEGLRSAAASGCSAGADVLARVKRLNDYLATGAARPPECNVLRRYRESFAMHGKAVATLIPLIPSHRPGHP